MNDIENLLFLVVRFDIRLGLRSTAADFAAADLLYLTGLVRDLAKQLLERAAQSFAMRLK